MEQFQGRNSFRITEFYNTDEIAHRFIEYLARSEWVALPTIFCHVSYQTMSGAVQSRTWLGSQYNPENSICLPSPLINFVNEQIFARSEANETELKCLAFSANEILSMNRRTKFRCLLLTSTQQNDDEPHEIMNSLEEALANGLWVPY